MSISLLLDLLPLELRREIWGFVFPHQTVHLAHLRTGWEHIICIADGNEEEAHAQWLRLITAAEDEWADFGDLDETPKATDIVRRHNKCKSLRSTRDRRVDLRLLRVSKQIHLEASEALYQNTTFAFEHPSSFGTFVSSLMDTQRCLLRSLQLNCGSLSNMPGVEWAHQTTLPTIQSLVGLQRLYIYCGDVWLSNMSTVLRRWQVLPLKTVTVVVEAPKRCGPQVRELADGLRDKVLDRCTQEVYEDIKRNEEIIESCLETILACRLVNRLR